MLNSQILMPKFLLFLFNKFILIQHENFVDLILPVVISMHYTLLCGEA